MPVLTLTRKGSVISVLSHVGAALDGAARKRNAALAASVLGQFGSRCRYLVVPPLHSYGLKR